MPQGPGRRLRVPFPQHKPEPRHGRPGPDSRIFLRMLSSSFHPVVARWFTERLGQPTPAQVQGWEAIRAGRHTLISSPTGSGKTLAAFLIELDLLLRESLEGTLPEETRVVYVSPLKALS